ncbi:LLM class flavin-dependent oxidoreductase [Spirillospora sp. CA-128828]|uniref:LLM class flavin-dependent oxidoreductase n=1 Tax=Spirillospora sp. CA-128828 TaxID=3240033 RepID=UPI003D920E37
MDIGIGLPSTIPGIPGRLILDWAAAAEQAGFSTLATIDRVVYPNLETVPTLAAAAAVTERIGLTTAVLIAPFRGNGALLAKQLATVDTISGGRLRVGVAVGPREDDYARRDRRSRDRGRILDQQLAELRAVWAQRPRGHAVPIGPAPVRPGGPPLFIGGNVAATFRRIAEFGTGWIFGGGGPEPFAAGADQVGRAWREAGRAGEPRLVVNAYVSLGPDAEYHARRYLGDYYGFTGDFAEQIVAGALTSPKAVTDVMTAYEDAGCDEMILFPCNPDLAQISLIVEAARADRHRKTP